MSIDKLELWRKGDKLTATKLNDALQAVNSLIELENDRLEQAASSNESGGVQYNSVSLIDNVPSWYQDVTPLWDQDGVTVIYDSWDGLGELTKQSGLYGRQTGENTLTSASYTDNSTLNLLSPETEIKAGQQVVQVITVNSSGSISKNEIMIYNSVSEIPNSTLNPCGESKLYRRLSRIIPDCSNGSAESMPQPSAAWLYKSVATNDLTLSPIAVPAIYSAACYSDVGICNSLALKCQVAQMVRQEGIFSKIKGIQNRGGLMMTDQAKVVKISSGVEFYSASDSTGQGATFGSVNKGLVPYAECLTIAEFPIKNTIYEWDNTQKDYKPTTTTDSKLKITAQPLNANSWQWGFTYSGDASLSTYKYIPSEQPQPTPATTVSDGEGISVRQIGNDYQVSRNLYLEAGASTDENGQTVDNAISIVCCKNNNKITYKLYAPKAAPCTYEFDPAYFTVTDNQVSLNAAALYDIAVEVANEIEVEVTACGIVDTISSGKIKTTTQGLSLNGTQYNATTRASVVSC